MCQENYQTPRQQPIPRFAPAVAEYYEHEARVGLPLNLTLWLSLSEIKRLPRYDYRSIQIKMVGEEGLEPTKS